ncbi:TPM domain-containing protein [Actimicrobium sp. CCC2.4]|uniref:TPM domain-containing protein n=1 Tax=Actimicrobium sp. CCC2.4 TaxID=3048606 RepID=UPI002AC9584D|nr:TPM domain-containing protein [Actimicrobium sp. CCC2.4]MEB0135132.1 TPM domain-containing protein [Actimicrobium sp. CCC2.4]WPX34214.1 TPM domain-containing protein [Actimicrobium sp. CCC2.4]
MALTRFLVAVLLAGSLSLAAAQALVAVPPLTGHVVDQAAMLQAPQLAALEATLTQYEARTGSQIGVLLVPNTAPETIEQYSIRVADAWKLGRTGVDDGVILLVAKDNPKGSGRLRIEAGRGVQGSLTDLQSKRILQEAIAPYFQRNDFNGGLAAGTTAIMSLLDKEQLPAAPAQTAPPRDASISLEVLLPVLLPFLLLGAVVLAGALTRGRRGRNYLEQGGHGRTEGVILGSAIAGGSFADGNRGGGFSGGGFSGGGFSGGGGGFDGGGASGDW